MGKFKEILKLKRIEMIENKIEQYKKYINSENNFLSNLNTVVKSNLDIWLYIAKENNLKTERVLIKEALEITAGYEEYKPKMESTIMESTIPDIGDITIVNNKGTVIFVDISKSTSFFKEKENYTGFVIFNSYISLVKTYMRLSEGEFLEHTGDGSMIFYKRDIISDYDDCQYLIEHPLCMLFYIGYLLQNEAEKKNLLEIKKENYSLVHIGADYGDVLDVNLGDMRKMISQTVWNAANNCKNAPRNFGKNNREFFKLPIKVK